MFFIDQVTAQSFKQRSDGKGNATAVLDQFGHPSGELVVNGIHRGSIEIDGGITGLYQVGKLRDGHESVTEGAGNLPVDFADDECGLFHCLPGRIHSEPQTAIAVFVRWGDLHKRGLNRDLTGFDQVRDPGEVAWNQIDPALHYGILGDPAGKKGLETVLLRSEFSQGNGVAETDQLNEFQVGHAGSDEDAHSGFDFPDHLLRADNFGLPLIDCRFVHSYHLQPPD